MMPQLQAYRSGFWRQLIELSIEPIDFVLTVVLLPCFYSTVFLLIIQHAGKLGSLAIYGIVGPAVLSLWANAVMASGELIEEERGAGTLELLVITPAWAMEANLLGRIMANTLFALLALVETIIIARLGFGVSVHISNAIAVGAGFLVLVLSTVAAAFMMSTIFVLARSVRIFQNALTFPFYVLSGLAFPLSVLPVWLRPFSSVIALSWGNDLVRSGFSQVPVFAPMLSFVVGTALTALYFVIGHHLFLWAERLVRVTATLGSY